jgi:hypothetical protein
MSYQPAQYEAIRHFGTLVGVITNPPKTPQHPILPCDRCGTRRQVHLHSSRTTNLCKDCYSVVRLMGEGELEKWRNTTSE